MDNSIIFSTIRIIIVLLVLNLSFSGYFGNYEDVEKINYMDAYEKHYDADSYFVLIDTNNDLVGIYYGYEPKAHFKQHIEFDELDRVCTLETLSSKGFYLNDEIWEFLESQDFPISTPVVIDRYPN